jgi:hypothetical protein
MREDPIRSIRIAKKISFFGPGDSLENRLRKVTLRGFPDVAIYKNASFTLRKLKVATISRELYSPQPHIYKKRMQDVNNLAALFRTKGIDIFHLDMSYDYIAETQSGAKTEWTMLPPVVERIEIPLDNNGTLDYQPLLAEPLLKTMDKHGWPINPEIRKYRYKTGAFSLINDGAHRVQAGIENGGGITVLEISGITPGYPYYALPRPYKVVEFSLKEDAPDLKVHILSSPGHKQLYRLFPTGGIMSGTVRSAKKGEKII